MTVVSSFKDPCFWSAMAASLPFSSLSPRPTKKIHDTLITATRAEFPLYTSSANGKCWSKHKIYKGTVSPSIHPKKNNMWKPCCDKQPIELSSSETDLDAKIIVEQLYSSINNKKLDSIHVLIADKCFFEELSFPRPFQERKEVMHFLEELTKAMGKDVKFKTEMIYRGGVFAAGVTWHLEWKGKEIPFTKGCSFYECVNEGEMLVIKKARIVTEAPVKPGVLVLKLLKMITYLFDKYPQLSERFLLHPTIIINMLLKIYKMFITPIIQPVLLYYTHLWTFTTWLLSFLLKIVNAIMNLFR